MLRAIHIGGMHVSMYSLMLFCGIVAFYVLYIVLVERKERMERASSNRLIVVSALGIAVLGASALVFNSIFHSIEKGELVIGGITWLGGVVGMIPFMIFMIHAFVPQAKGNAVYYFSILMPGLVLGHMFGRLGCFFAGCCYGQVTDSVFGVSFPAGSAAANLYPGGPNGGSLPVLPTQLFEAAFELVLFIVLIVFYKRLKKYNVEIYMISYGVFRFIMEFFRGDDRGGTGFFLTPSQLLCIFLLLGAMFLILYRNGLIFKKLQAKCVVWQQEAKEAAEKPKTRRVTRTERVENESLSALKELHAMKEEGLITEDEFNAKKKEILKRL